MCDAWSTPYKRRNTRVTKGELVKKLEKYDDDADIVVVGRVYDELLDVGTVRINRDGQVVLRPA
jgi:hypothetical protein